MFYSNYRLTKFDEFSVIHIICNGSFIVIACINSLFDSHQQGCRCFHSHSCSDVVGAALTVAHILRLKVGTCRVNISNLQFSAREIVNIVILDLTNAFTSALYSISNLQIQSAIDSFGSSASADNDASA